MTDVVEHRITVQRTARYYTLGQVDDANELWLVVHGYGQLAARFIRHFRPIAMEQRLIVAPEALLRFYLDPHDRPASERRVGASWMTREDRETDIADYVRYLDQLVKQVDAGRNLPITALGFSQGVATIARWALHSAAPLSRLFFWGSLLPPDLDWPRAAQRFQGLQLRSIVGTQDEFSDEARLRQQQEWAQENGLDYASLAFEGGHTMDGPTLKRLAENTVP